MDIIHFLNGAMARCAVLMFYLLHYGMSDHKMFCCVRENTNPVSGYTGITPECYCANARVICMVSKNYVADFHHRTCNIISTSTFLCFIPNSPVRFLVDRAMGCHIVHIKFLFVKKLETLARGRAKTFSRSKHMVKYAVLFLRSPSLSSFVGSLSLRCASYSAFSSSVELLFASLSSHHLSHLSFFGK